MHASQSNIEYILFMLLKPENRECQESEVFGFGNHALESQ